ncbi:hypothetical protein GALL_472960 [mine drainage metagenome]|uniref:Uncharacterized protein n=1 Tax=mine drainage metagenome TaxID=410659 RepID=A0A1J5PJU3_9ZZZZ
MIRPVNALVCRTPIRVTLARCWMRNGFFITHNTPNRKRAARKVRNAPNWNGPMNSSARFMTTQL